MTNAAAYSVTPLTCFRNFKSHEYSFVSTGVFTTPHAGVYYFTFTYEAKDNKSGLSLMKNSSVIVKGADNNQKGEYLTDNGGNSAVLQLQSGDKVFVQLPANHCVWGADNTTSFSGFLITK